MVDKLCAGHLTTEIERHYRRAPWSLGGQTNASLERPGVMPGLLGTEDFQACLDRKAAWC